MGRLEKLLFAWLVAMLVGVATTAGYVVVDHATRCDRFKFSAEDWRHPHGQRGEIAGRLIDCHRLQGLTATEIRERLGNPMDRSRTRIGLVWSYGAGTYEDFVFGGSRTLEVEFTPGRVVRRVRMSYLSD